MTDDAQNHAQKNNLTGILLCNLGTPDAPTPGAVRQYLAEFLSDPRVVNLPKLIWWPILHGIILRIRPSQSAKLYQAIWTEKGSPLLVNTLAQAEALQQQCDPSEEKIKVVAAMRYGNPSIADGLETLKALNVKKIVVLPVYPQYSATTTGSVFDEVTRVLKTWRFIPELNFINGYADSEKYIAAVAESISQQLSSDGFPDKLLFSFHGLPEAHFKKGDPYYCYCHKTVRLIAERLGLDASQYQLCFQSRVGKAKWLGPYTDAVLMSCAKENKRHVAVVCPGFASDCLETLEEIAVRYKEVFIEAGGKKFTYIPCLNASRAGIDVLESVVQPYL